MNIITYQASDVIDFLLHNEAAPPFGAQEVYESLREKMASGQDTVSHDDLLNIAQYFYGNQEEAKTEFVRNIQSNINCYFVLPEDESEYFIDEELF
jgi:hypothetical protein